MPTFIDVYAEMIGKLKAKDLQMSMKLDPESWEVESQEYEVTKTWTHFLQYWPFVLGIHQLWVALLALCAGNPLVTSGFPAQRTSNAKPWWFLCNWINLEDTVEWPVKWETSTLMRRNHKVTLRWPHSHPSAYVTLMDCLILQPQ